MMVWDVAILVEFIMTWNWFKDDTLVLWCLYDFKIRNFQTSPSNPFSFPLSLQNHPASFLNRHPPSSEDTVVDTFGEHNKNQQNQALIDVDPTTFETLELPHEQQAGPEMLPCDPPCWLMIFIWGNILTYTLGIVIFHQRNPYSSQFMTPPSQQRIEGKWVSVCQLWAMMTQEERESSCQKEVWSRWRRKTWVPLRAQASHHITSKPGGFEYVWITHNTSPNNKIKFEWSKHPTFPVQKRTNLKCIQMQGELLHLQRSQLGRWHNPRGVSAKIGT